MSRKHSFYIFNCIFHVIWCKIWAFSIKTKITFISSNNYTDSVAGINGVTPYTADLKIKNLWDINFGMGFQMTVPLDIKLYAGPYVYYSEAKASLDSNIPGIDYAAGNVSIRNKSIVGGFAGVDLPLFKGFHINVEGQYADRFSAGVAMSYTY